MQRFKNHGVAAFTTHDLRREGRTGLGRLGVNADIAERALNHLRKPLQAAWDVYSKSLSTSGSLASGRVSVDADSAYALRDKSERERRKGMLRLPHMAPLVDYTDRLRERSPGAAIPLFDPCDGGINAKLLFLLEAPGPKAVGSAFISRNNPDQSARNMNSLLAEAHLPRSACLLWNIVPWYLGDGKRIRAATKTDVATAIPYLSELLSLLTALRAIVLIGKPAASAAPAIAQLSDRPLYFAPHPSPRVFNLRPEKRAEALAVFQSLGKHL